MSDCCKPPGPERPAPVACPACAAPGQPVRPPTVEALLMAVSARRLAGQVARMCRTATCRVLYFGEDGTVADKAEARVRVGLKETEDPVPLCYCFGFTRAHVREELSRTGACSIPDRIAAEVRAGRCACDTKNPSGACCLGEVKRTVRELAPVRAAQSR